MPRNRPINVILGIAITFALVSAGVSVRAYLRSPQLGLAFLPGILIPLACLCGMASLLVRRKRRRLARRLLWIALLLLIPVWFVLLRNAA